MDRVAGEGVVRHRRPCHLERSRRKRVHVADARVRTEREVEARATRAEEKLILRRQARVTARKTQDADIRRDRADAADIGRRQRRVELLVRQIGAAEEFAAIGRGRDLVLMRLGEIRARRAVCVDDAFGQKVQDPLACVWAHRWRRGDRSCGFRRR